MKAAIVFSGGGPVLFLTTYKSLDHPEFIEKPAGRGISKFIPYEIDLEKVRKKYVTSPLPIWLPPFTMTLS